MYIIRINVIRIFEQFEIQTEAKFFFESRKILERFKSLNYFYTCFKQIHIIISAINIYKYFYTFLNETIIN